MGSLREIQGMLIDPRSNDSRIQHHFKNPSVGEGSSVCVGNFGIGDLRKEMKQESPQHRWRPPEKSRFTYLDQAIEHELKHGRQMNPKMDMKTLRRTISNRLSAQRSRKKRLQHISELEKKIKELEVLISCLRPNVEIYREKKRMLEEEKDFLTTAVEIRITESITNEYKIEESRQELYSLKQGLDNDQGLFLNQIQDPVADADQSNSDMKPYSMVFYQQRLMKMNPFLIPSSEAVSITAASQQDSMIELNFDGDDQAEESRSIS